VIALGLLAWWQRARLMALPAGCSSFRSAAAHSFGLSH